jgi:hypothetical protein
MNRLLLFILLVTGFAQAQIVNIPDSFFKQALVSASPLTYSAYNISGQPMTIDTNSDGEIQVSEALNVGELKLGGLVQSFAGIQAFANLQALQLYYCDATTLDLSGMANLRLLWATYGQLSSVNLSGTAIETVNLSCNNPLTTLDFSGLSTLKSFTSNNGQLQSLNLSGCTALQLLQLDNNQLTSLDLSGLISLKNVYIRYNDIMSLNLSGFPVLKALNCVGNQIVNLDCSNSPLVNIVEAGENQLVSANFSGCENLETLVLGLNPALSVLNIDGTLNMHDLYVNDTALTELDLSNNTSLSMLACSNSQLQSLNITGCNALEFLYADGNNFTTFELPALELLEDCFFDGNPLITFFMKNGYTDGVSLNCPSLEYICVDPGEENNVLAMMEFYNLPNVIINSYCNFTPGGVYNTITGEIRFDADNNGCTDADLPMPGINVNINDGENQGATFTNSLGSYTFFVQQPDIVITPSIENAAYFNIAPATANVNFPVNNNSAEIRSFCITANGVHPDLEIIMVPIAPARPGFDAVYKLIYKNKGNQVMSGNISVIFEDAVLDFVSASQTPASQSSGNLLFDYSELRPFEQREITLILNVNSPMETPAVNIGDQLELTVAANPLEGDETPLDNEFTLKQTVVGSFDPNNKICLEGDVLWPEEIGDYLHYIINFENTGTYPAENVVIKDMIDPDKFDISTLQVFGASHNSQTNITSDKAEFIFQGIDLAPNEYGYMAFKVKTKSTLQTGDTATNKANIYFDFNFPVETNEASTTFQSLGVEEHAMEKIRVYPNPATRLVNIRTVAEIKSIAAFDIQGRIVESHQVSGKDVSLDISRYAKGIYYLKIITDKGNGISKIIKE